MEHPSGHPYVNCVTSYNISSQGGKTPLLLAIRKKNIAIVRELVAVGADVNYIEDVSETIVSISLYMYTQY